MEPKGEDHDLRQKVWWSIQGQYNYRTVRVQFTYRTVRRQQDFVLRRVLATGSPLIVVRSTVLQLLVYK